VEESTSPARVGEEAVGIAKRGVCKIDVEIKVEEAGAGAGRGAGVEVNVGVAKRSRADLRKEEVVKETLPEYFISRRKGLKRDRCGFDILRSLCTETVDHTGQSERA